MKLTVILRDDAPFVCMGDSPSYRSVQIELTPDQEKQIEGRFTHEVAGSPFYENISKCFIEPDSQPSGVRK